ncbi:MAG: FG-GAP-like repeat-containing protein [Planctomycetota bacterium]
MGCAAGDIDNDGDVDLYLTCFGPNLLFRNDGGGRFTDITGAAGVGDPLWGSSAAFADFDGDGFLDLYLCNYLDFTVDKHKRCTLGRGIPAYCSPDAYPGAPDRLYRNDGDGTFTDVTREAGIGLPGGKGLGVLCGDFDGDGRVDLYLANDGVANRLFRNLGGFRFEDVTLVAGVGHNDEGMAQAGMGIAGGDLDGDGLSEIFVTNLSAETNVLYRGGSGGLFSDATQGARLGAPSLLMTGFGTASGDFDHDGDLDLFVANGHIIDNISLFNDLYTYRQHDQLVENDGRGVFTERTSEAVSGPPEPGAGRGAAAGDVDGDGDLDLVVTNCEGRPILYRNDTPARGDWLILRLAGRRSNRDGIGARVELEAGGRTQARELFGGGSYLSASDPRIHFGLGGAKVAERITIHWPSGTRQTLRDVRAGRVVTVVEGEEVRDRDGKGKGSGSGKGEERGDGDGKGDGAGSREEVRRRPSTLRSFPFPLLRWGAVLLHGTTDPLQDDLLRRARVAFEGGDLEGAIALLEGRPDLDDPAALRILIECYRSTERLAEGVRLGQRIEARAATDPPLAISLALVYAEEGGVRRGEDLLERALAGHPRHARLLIELARLRFSVGNHSSAAALGRRAIAAGETGAGARTLLGASLARLGELDDAEAALRAALDLDGRHARARFELARIHRRRGDLPAAIAELRRCLAIQPRHLAALFNLGNALIRAGGENALLEEEGRRALAAFARRNTAAEREKDLRQQVRVNPGNQRALVELGRFLIADGRGREALPVLERALARESRRGDLHGDRARALRGAGRATEARAELERALALDPALLALRLELAELCAAAGDLECAERELALCGGAVEAGRWHLACAEVDARRGKGWETLAPTLKQVIDADPRSLEAILAWVDAALAFNKDREAERELLTWQEQHPANPRFPLACGVLALERGRLDAARALLESARAIDPWWPEPCSYLAQLERRLGRPAGAKRLARRARELRILVVE